MACHFQLSGANQSCYGLLIHAPNEAMTAIMVDELLTALAHPPIGTSSHR